MSALVAQPARTRWLEYDRIVPQRTRSKGVRLAAQPLMQRKSLPWENSEKRVLRSALSFSFGERGVCGALRPKDRTKSKYWFSLASRDMV